MHLENGYGEHVYVRGVAEQLMAENRRLVTQVAVLREEVGSLMLINQRLRAQVADLKQQSKRLMLPLDSAAA